MNNSILRFAPSPTGFLHLGSARTALYNWLQAKASGGKVFLRIEDTDKERSKKDFEDSIKEGLDWLGIDFDGETVYQSTRIERHREVALKLLKEGKAYRCSAGSEEIASLRAAGKRSPWRDKICSDESAAIRLKAPQQGATTILDKVQGKVVVENSTLDDMVILRSDGTPTYMLAVAVDDHDMGVNLVLRGDDHLTNTFRQCQLFSLADWEIPDFAHIPLIAGSDGAKLSKRHGALGINHYKDQGYLPKAICAYLLRLGWGKGDKEIISLSEATEIFNISEVGKSMSKFDLNKLRSFNNSCLQELSDEALQNQLLNYIPSNADEVRKQSLLKGSRELAKRASTLTEMVEQGSFYLKPPTRPYPDDKAEEAASIDEKTWQAIIEAVSSSSSSEEVMVNLRKTAEDLDIKFAKVAKAVRAGLTGSMSSPSIGSVIDSLGIDESLVRLKKVATKS